MFSLLTLLFRLWLGLALFSRPIQILRVLIVTDRLGAKETLQNRVLSLARHIVA